MFNFLKRNTQYTHNPIPFDDVQAQKAITPQAPAQKSYYGSDIFGGAFDLNTAARNYDLPASSWGVAVALTASVAAYRCNGVRSNHVGSMKNFLRYRGTDKRIAESSDSKPKHPFYAALNRAEKKHGDSFFGLWEYGYGVHGEAYIEKISNRFDFPTDILWLDPLYMSVFAPRGIITEFTYSGIEGTLRLPAHCVTFDRYRHPYDHLRGLSPLEVALQGINISRALKQEILNFFKRAMRPGVLVSPGKDTQFDEADAPFIQQYLMNNAVGSANAHKPLITPKHTEITKFDPPSLVDQSDLEQRIEKSIHKAYGVSPAMTGDPDGTRYQSADDEDEWLFKNTIQPECERIARVVNRDLLPFFDDSGDLEFAFDYDGYSFVTEKDERLARVAQIYFESGLATRDESREVVGLPKLPTGGDVFVTDIQPAAAPALPEMAQAPAVTPELPDPQPDMITLPATDVSRRAVQGDALSELGAWYKFLSKGSKRNFEPVHTGGVIASYVQLSLDDGDDQKDVFEVAKSLIPLLSNKTWTDTRSGFIKEVRELFRAAQADEINRRNFAAKMRAVLRKYGLLAYRDGMNDAGYDPESFSKEELATFRDWQARQSAFVSKVGEEVATLGISEKEVDLRAEMWTDNSLREIYTLGVAAGNPGTKMIWLLGDAEHCDVCPDLHGVVMTEEDWRKSGYRPKNGKTPCRLGCKCSLTVTNRPLTKRLPAVLVAALAGKSVHIHGETCDHEHS